MRLHPIDYIRAITNYFQYRLHASYDSLHTSIDTSPLNFTLWCWDCTNSSCLRGCLPIYRASTDVPHSEVSTLLDILSALPYHPLHDRDIAYYLSFELGKLSSQLIALQLNNAGT